MEHPFSDDYMIFNTKSNRYIPTEKALLDNGIDIRNELAATATVTPENVINSFLQLVSDMIYGYIHAFNYNNPLQDRLIAELPSLRNIMLEAMIYQAIYVYNNGNLLLSTKPEERARAYDDTAMQYLSMEVPEIRKPITFQGRL